MAYIHYELIIYKFMIIIIIVNNYNYINLHVKYNNIIYNI